MNHIELWACAEIQAIDSSFAQLDTASQLSENLFTSGRLDSMGLMNLLVSAEAQFGFAFSAESFQDRRIQTVAGLSEVIAELLATND
jgi:acyl carrier protein